jgi:hypothetical protein
MLYSARIWPLRRGAKARLAAAPIVARYQEEAGGCWFVCDCRPNVPLRLAAEGVPNLLPCLVIGDSIALGVGVTLPNVALKHASALPSADSRWCDRSLAARWWSHRPLISPRCLQSESRARADPAWQWAAQ